MYILSRVPFTRQFYTGCVQWHLHYIIDFLCSRDSNMPGVQPIPFNVLSQPLNGALEESLPGLRK